MIVFNKRHTVCHGAPALETIMLKLTCGVLSTLALALPLTTHADYPERPVTLVVPSVPGGAADTVARLVAEGLNQHWKTSVIVENRPGGNSLIATQHVIKAAPDGYTLLMGFDISFSAMPYLMERMPFDPQRDLTPVTTLASVDYLLLASPSAPFHTVKELLDQAKAKPGTITFASGGEGSNHHLGMEMLAHEAGVSFRHVPYKAAPQGFVDVMGGHVDIMILASGTATPPIQTKKVQGLAHTSHQAMPQLPELPALQNTLPGFTYDSWFGLFAPAGTSAAIVKKLESSVQEVLRNPQIKAKLDAQGLRAGEGGAEALKARILADTERTKPIITKLKASK